MSILNFTHHHFEGGAVFPLFGFPLLIPSF
jgi:hypothetical protein